MIADRINTYLRGDVAPTAERIAWAEAILTGSALHSFRRNFIVREDRDEGRAAVSASSSWYCSRKLTYDLTRAEREPFQPRAHLTFHIGDCVEDMAVALAVLAGVDVRTPDAAGLQRTVTLDVGDGAKIPGHIDMVIGYDGAEAPVEVKSMSEYGWEKSKKEGVDDTFNYVTQLQFYLHALDVRRGFFLGVNKSTGAVFEQEISRDPRALDRITVAWRTAKLSEAEGSVPPRPEWATVKMIAGCEQIESARCGYCAYRPTCWPDHKMTVVSGKPVYRKPVATAEAR